MFILGVVHHFHHLPLFFILHWGGQPDLGHLHASRGGKKGQGEGVSVGAPPDHRGGGARGQMPRGYPSDLLLRTTRLDHDNILHYTVSNPKINVNCPSVTGLYLFSPELT